jgi:hypothetical protein
MLKTMKALGTIEWWVHKAWGMKIVLLAALFTGLETLVQLGIELPGSKAIPQWARGLVYMVIVGAAFILRYYAAKKGPPNG